MDRKTRRKEKRKLDRIKKTAWQCDFETTTGINFDIEGRVRVWLWGAKHHVTGEWVFGKSIESFMQFLERDDVKSVFFHNLSFDFAFIENYLLENNYHFDMGAKWKMLTRSYQTLKSTMGTLYSSVIKLRNGRMVDFYDTAKVYPLPLEKLGDAFGIKKLKDNFDYFMYRPVGYEPTEDEMEYLRHDIMIQREAMEFNWEQMGYFRLTRSSYAYEELIHYWCLDRFGSEEDIPVNYMEEFEAVFPKSSPVEQYKLRNAYAGGIVYVNPRYKRQILRTVGMVFDVNSEYPGVMLTKMFPKGAAIYGTGAYKKDDKHPLYIQRLKCKFKAKAGEIPSLPKKLSIYNKAVTSHDDLIHDTLLLTNIDLAHFFRNYDVWDIEWIEYYKFEGVMHPFKSFIEAWAAKKIDADKEHNEPMRLMCKLTMNGAYGKFAQSTKQNRKASYMEDGVIKYREVEMIEHPQKYYPMGIFITAWARDTFLNGMYAFPPERRLYGDTDSVHVLGFDIPDKLDVDPYELGKWKPENVFDSARFLRDKSYAENVMSVFDRVSTEDELCEEINKYEKILNITIPKFKGSLKRKQEQLNEHFKNIDVKDMEDDVKKIYKKLHQNLDIKCAGLSDEAKVHIKTLDDFDLGRTYEGSKVKKQVKGGILIVTQSKTLSE